MKLAIFVLLFILASCADTTWHVDPNTKLVEVHTTTFAKSIQGFELEWITSGDKLVNFRVTLDKSDPDAQIVESITKGFTNVVDRLAPLPVAP
jgi:hypothetical protein